MKTLNNLRDKYLLFKAKHAGDAEAYGEIYDRYVERIYRFIFYKVGSKADAEDLSSEVFLKAWQYLRDGQEIRNLNAFLYSIARNSIIDYYRLTARKKEFESNYQEYETVHSEESLEKLDISADKENILVAIKKLKDEYSEVLILKFFDDLTVREIAEIIGKSPNNIRVLIHRSLQALRKILEINNIA